MHHSTTTSEADYLRQLDLVERQEKVAHRFEQLLLSESGCQERAEAILQASLRLASLANKDSDRALELVDVLRKVIKEGGTLLTAKAMTQALDDYERHQGPLDHRTIPKKVLNAS